MADDAARLEERKRKQREAQKKYRSTERGKMKHREDNSKYAKSEKGRAWTSEYNKTEKVKERVRKYQDKNKEELAEYRKGRKKENAEAARRYRNTEEGREKSRKYGREYSQSTRGIISVYRKNAPKRGRKWCLSEEEATKLIEGTCRYCNKVPAKGIDRVDNEKDYVKENVVSCCKTHNMMKGQLSHEEFVIACREVVLKDIFSKHT